MPDGIGVSPVLHTRVKKFARKVEFLPKNKLKHADFANGRDARSSIDIESCLKKTKTIVVSDH